MTIKQTQRLLDEKMKTSPYTALFKIKNPDRSPKKTTSPQKNEKVQGPRKKLNGTFDFFFKIFGIFDWCGIGIG